MSGHVYSVPAAVVFRRWAAHADPAAPIKRKLLLKNDGERAVSFRLSLPQHAAFEVSGSLVASASPGEGCDVELPAGGSTSLTITLRREHADEIECRDELCVRMAAGCTERPAIIM